MNALHVSTPILAHGVTLIPVERVRIVAAGQHQAHWFNATKEVVALVICGPVNSRAVDIGGRELPLDQVIDEVPGLRQAMAGLESCRPIPDDFPHERP